MKFFHSFMRIVSPTSTLQNQKGATIVELMVVLAILWLGITALLETLSGAINFAQDTENNIKAINIAREWIEWMTNIRDTNWLRFSSDKTNCWKVHAYRSWCIGNSSPAFYPASNVWGESLSGGNFTIYSQNGAWYLSGISSTPPYTTWTAYRSIYQVWLDGWGFYTQTGVSSTACSVFQQKNCKTLFTREIILKVPGGTAATGTLIVQSIARWYDRRPQSVILETTLTNWKSNF